MSSALQDEQEAEPSFGANCDRLVALVSAKDPPKDHSELHSLLHQRDMTDRAIMKVAAKGIGAMVDDFKGNFIDEEWDDSRFHVLFVRCKGLTGWGGEAPDLEIRMFEGGFRGRDRGGEDTARAVRLVLQTALVRNELASLRAELDREKASAQLPKDQSAIPPHRRKKPLV